MSGRGKEETKQLITKVQEQLQRLVGQLADLEELRDELGQEEYESNKKDTLAQLKEFQTSLNNMTKGDVTLVDSLNSVQLAIQATISNAFKTPEVIKSFAQKQPDQLRIRLTNLQRDSKLGKISKDAFNQQATEVLAALKKLGQTLSPEESNFLSQNMNKPLEDFEKVSNTDVGTGLLSAASSQIKKKRLRIRQSSIKKGFLLL